MFASIRLQFPNPSSCIAQTLVHNKTTALSGDYSSEDGCSSGSRFIVTSVVSQMNTTYLSLPNIQTVLLKYYTFTKNLASVLGNPSGT